MKTNTQERVAQAIRVQRVRAGLPSEAELARRVGLLPSSLSKRLNGDLELSLSEVEKIAIALGVDAFTLLDMARTEVTATAA